MTQCFMAGMMAGDRRTFCFIPKNSMKSVVNFAQLKKFFLGCFIGSLIVAALVAVVTVLIGEFNDVTAKVFLTLSMVVLHALASLLFIWDDARRDTFENLAFFTNVVFLIIVASFITTIFAIWSILDIDTFWNVYSMLFYIGFAALHANLLSKATKKEKYLDAIIYANYFCIVAVLLMLAPATFIEEAPSVLGDFYYRQLAAIGIVDGTLSILTMIFYKLYMIKHPKEMDLILGSPAAKKPQARRGLGLWVGVLLIYLLFQMFGMAIWVINGLL